MAHKKHKASASAHAQDRAQRENHLAEAPAVTRSNRDVDQRRAVAESPLYGEDRPIGEPGGKLNRPSHLEETGNLGKPGHAVADPHFNQRVRGGQIVPEERPLSEEAKR